MVCVHILIHRNCSHSKIWLKQERQDRRTHQVHQFLKGVLAIAFGSVQDQLKRHTSERPLGAETPHDESRRGAKRVHRHCYQQVHLYGIGR
jgi:hypothetical protein